MDRNSLLNDAETAQRYALDGRQAGLWTAIPGFVQSVDLTAMTLVVQPAIKVQQSFPDGSTQFVNMPLLLDVPIVFPNAGGFIMTFPITQGDEVLVIFSSRCIDDWWQSGGIGIPLEFRMHDLSDGFAIPGPKSQPHVVAGISASNLRIQTNDGTCFIEMTPAGRINITAPQGVHVNGEVYAFTTPLHTHVHSDPSEGNTGPPIP